MSPPKAGVLVKTSGYGETIARRQLRAGAHGARSRRGYFQGPARQLTSSARERAIFSDVVIGGGIP